MKSFLGNFYRHLAAFYWSHCLKFKLLRHSHEATIVFKGGHDDGSSQGASLDHLVRPPANVLLRRRRRRLHKEDNCDKDRIAHRWGEKVNRSQSHGALLLKVAHKEMNLVGPLSLLYINIGSSSLSCVHTCLFYAVSCCVSGKQKIYFIYYGMR